MKKALVLAGLAAGLFMFAHSNSADAGHRRCGPGYRGYSSYGHGHGYGHRGFGGRSFYGPRYDYGFRGRGYGRGYGYDRGFYGRRDGRRVRTPGFFLGIGR